MTKLNLTYPISVDEFMSQALYNEDYGYYMKKIPMGDKSSDFITAPELSPIFGEVIAFWILNKICENSRKIDIIELGAGQGTMALDILTTLQKLMPNNFSNLEYNIVEISPYLITSQQQKLKDFSNVKWINSYDKFNNDNLTIVLANEFFDALPAKQYQKQNGQYFERLINEKHEFILASEPTFIGKQYNEDIVEIYPALDEIITKLKQLEAEMLIIDYGNLGTSETLQAIKNHKKIDIFEDISNSDLTTQVDFRQIIKHFEGSAKVNISTMADFLVANGILIRAEQLLENASQSQQQNLNFVLQKLLDEKQMGKIFKALEVSHID